MFEIPSGRTVTTRPVDELERELAAAKGADRPVVIVIDTDPAPSTEAGGSWWEVAVPEVSARDTVRAARVGYEADAKAQRLVD